MQDSPKISVLLASRARPRKAKQTADKWLLNAGCQVEFIASIDFSDNQSPEYRRLFDKHMLVESDNRSAVDAFNEAAKICKGDIIIGISDDFDCPDNWGKIILDATKGQKDWLLKTWDGAQKYIVTLPIMDRAFYKSNGYLYHPEFGHMFVDTDLTHKADIEGKVIWRNDIVFEHQHYSTGKGVKDDISRKADLTWNQGQSLYLQRCKEAFGTGKDIWNIHENGAGHKLWLQNKLR